MTTAIRHTAAHIGWYPRCPCSSPADTLTWACPLHDPLLQADCEGCSEREQRRATERMAERQARRQQEDETMAKLGSGFWHGETTLDGETVTTLDGETVTRLEVARWMREEGKGYGEIERTMGGPANSVRMALQRAERDRTAQTQPVPLQVTDKPAPADPALRDPLEARLPVQEEQREYSGPPLTRQSADGEYSPGPTEPRACSECEDCDSEQTPDCPFEEYDSQGRSPAPGPGVAEIEQVLQQATEQTAAGILQAFAESEAAEVMALVFEFLEYRGLEAECELFIRFGLWRSRRRAG